MTLSPLWRRSRKQIVWMFFGYWYKPGLKECPLAT